MERDLISNTAFADPTSAKKNWSDILSSASAIWYLRSVSANLFCILE